MFSWLKPRKSTTQNIPKADNGSLVVEGNVCSSTINIGIATEELKTDILPAIYQRLDEITEHVSKDKGIDESALRSILSKLEDTHIPREKIVNAFENAITQLIELRTSLARQTDGNEGIHKARQQADKEILSGDFSKAKETLESARLQAVEVKDSGRRAEAEILEDQAKISLLQSRYREAADFFARAAALLSDDIKATFDLLAKRATALQDLGELFGDDEGLTDAIEQWEEALSIVSEESHQKEHRKAENNLASALVSLGERQPTSELMRRATDIQNRILACEENSQDPFYRSVAAANLGTTLTALGRRENDLKTIRDGIDFLERAQNETDRNSRRKDFIGITMSIGNAYKVMAEISRNEALVETAIGFYRDAHSLIEDSDDITLWINVEDSIGTALTAKGVLNRKSETFEDAIEHLKAAAQKIDKSKSTSLWYRTNYNLATALTHLGIETGKIVNFEQALTINRSIFLSGVFRERTLLYAYAAWGVGMSHYQIAQRKYDITSATEAINYLLLSSSIISNSSDQRSKPGIAGALQEAINLRARLSAQQ